MSRVGGRHPCVAPYCGGPSRHRNFACEVHWLLLSDRARRFVDKRLDERHPRGGGIRTIPEGLFVSASAGGGIARREWKALMRRDIRDGMYDDSPEVLQELRRYAGLPS